MFQGYDRYDIFKACAEKNLQAIEWCIERDGKHAIETGFCAACFDGQADIVKIMIDKGADNLCDGLENACYSGHKDVALLVMDNVSSEYESRDPDIWERGLFSACECQNKEVGQELAHIIINKCEKKWSVKPDNFNGYIWEEGLYSACENGQVELAQLMIKKGINTWNAQSTNHTIRILNVALRRTNDFEITLMLAKNGANSYKGILYRCCTDLKYYKQRTLKVLLGLKNSNRKKFIFEIKKQQYVKGTLDFLANRHLIKIKSPSLKRKNILRNIEQIFTCNDVANFCMRFVDIQYPKKS